LQGETTLDDCLVSLNVLCYILLTMSKLMAAFTPFLAEYMYQVLSKFMGQSTSPAEQQLSVHFQMMPKSQSVVRSTQRARSVVRLFALGKC
jgi:isoleucyl-tRNA synthetase